MYTSSGSLIGRRSGERFYDASGRLLGRFDGERFYDARGRLAGRVDQPSRRAAFWYFMVLK
ncbi:MAG TPA: hypothetical protein DCL07_04215 [Cryomorphaceae bacterium]|jgi:hypothetical protein|nr:MAG: hypothetical protein ABR88_07415 [Cryomorphaceae bacterium BACL7 MAG-120322-bin74]HAG49131.1 hypothetical protein [Cryomorphaceae bacterium]